MREFFKTTRQHSLRLHRYERPQASFNLCRMSSLSAFSRSIHLQISLIARFRSIQRPNGFDVVVQMRTRLMEITRNVYFIADQKPASTFSRSRTTLINNNEILAAHMICPYVGCVSLCRSLVSITISHLHGVALCRGDFVLIIACSHC